MTTIEQYLLSFREGQKWIESDAADFRTVYASSFDHPVPSAVSLAEFGLIRAAVLSGKDVSVINYRQPYQCDFFNVSSMISNGLFHVFTSQKPLVWDQLPVNSLQLRGRIEQDCYMGTCRIPDKS
jgi:hypothetical protein